MGARDYSVTAASNLSVAGISLAEGMARASVNNSMRAQLADIADLLLDLGGATTTTGSGNAYLLALDTTPSALADNLLFLATSHHTNTSSSTLNLNGLGVKDIKKLAAGTPVSLGAQDFPAGYIGIFTYSSGNNAFLMLNPATALPVGAASAGFETRTTAAAAATAGTIPSSLDLIEVFGHTNGGDDVVASYTREIAAPAVGDSFLDDDGTWWVERAQGLQRVAGMATLRTYAPIDGRHVMLAYHTTVGDLGAGMFCGATGAPPATFVDNGGTIIVPTGGNGSAAWVRVWDGLTAHVGWFGAKCDLVTDDYAAVKKCLDLFTTGRTAVRTGAIDVGPGFAFGTSLVYGGTPGTSIRIFGHQALARGGQECSLLKYTGPVTEGAILFLGANESSLDDVNVFPGNALNGVVVTADSTHLSSLNSGVSAGTNVVATPSNVAQLTPGCFLGIDVGANFEIVYVTKVTATTFTATFTKNHSAGAQVGGGQGSSGMSFHRVRLISPESPVWTTLTVDALGGGVQTFTPGNMAGIGLGMPIRIGSFYTSEIVYPTAVTGSTFTATCNQSHVIGERIMYATAGVLVGNLLTITTQVSELTFQEVCVIGAVANRCYAGIRQNCGGNVKNFICHNMKYTNLVVPFAFERSSGQYLISGCVGAGATDTIILNNSAPITVLSLEDESAAMILRGDTGTSPIQATFIGCTWDGQAPAGANDEMVVYSGELTFIGCHLGNARTGATLPVLVVFNMRLANTPGSLTLINCHVSNATPTSGFVRDGLTIYGGGVDVIADGTGRLTMLGCIGGSPGSTVSLPTIVPPVSRWQNTATYNPPSLIAGAAAAVQTMTVTGAVLGDLVEVSYSINLNGAALNAWVSAADAVSYRFHNPTTGTVDLSVGTVGAGTVKIRVRK